MGVNKKSGSKETFTIFKKVWKQQTRGKPQHFTTNNPQDEFYQGCTNFPNI
jgi:hypothetical protein